MRSPQPANHPPTAGFRLSPQNPQVGEVASFDGSSSFDPDGFITDWHWVFEGENRLETRGRRVNVRFTAARIYRVTLTVVDNQGAPASTSQAVTVHETPPPPPPAPKGYGFLIHSKERDELQITVQGDPSWTADHRFHVILRMVSTRNETDGFTAVEARVVGNASLEKTETDREQPEMSGRVRDGQVIYTVGARSVRALLLFLTLDVDGDGDLEHGTTRVPVFVALGDRYVRVQPRRSEHQLWLAAEDGRLFPFREGEVLACGEDASNCVLVR